MREIGMEHPSLSNIGITPLSNALGAEIDGVDLSQPLEKAQFEDIQKALCTYGAIGFRNQKLSHRTRLILPCVLEPLRFTRL